MKKLLFFVAFSATACAPKPQIKMQDGGFQDYVKPQPEQELISAQARQTGNCQTAVFLSAVNTHKL